MIIRSPKIEEKSLMYQLYNSNTNLKSSEIDTYFKSDFNPKDFLIYKKDGMIMCAMKIINKSFYLYGITNEVNIIEDLIYTSNCPLNVKRMFIDKCFNSFKYSKLFTFVRKNIFNHPTLENTYFKKQYRLYRKDLYNVDGYLINEGIEEIDYIKTNQKFRSHFSSYLVKNELDYLAKLKQYLDNDYEIYSCVNQSNSVIGYIIYNYDRGEVVVEEIIYLDTLSLLTLLSQSMGLNNSISVSVSRSEIFERVFDQLKYEIEDDIYVRINDLQLFQRLYNTKTLSFNDFVREINRPVYFGSK